MKEWRALLERAEFQGHPLQIALRAACDELAAQNELIDRVTRISDGFQSISRDANASLAERLHRQIRHMEKVARISDRYQGMLQALNARLDHESKHDALTGLANRRHGRSVLSNLLQQHPEVGVALLDLDHFKQINDEFGHEAGDQALVRVASLLADAQLGAHLVARWGGEEFLLVFTEQSRECALEACRQLCWRIAAEAVDPAVPGRRLSASIGLSFGRLNDAFAGVLQRSDQALYAAKAAGRGRVEVSQ
jgi:diguanylate cyclase (GGDEF)-like protein